MGNLVYVGGLVALLHKLLHHLVTVNEELNRLDYHVHPGTDIGIAHDGVEPVELFSRMVGGVADITDVVVAEQKVLEGLSVGADCMGPDDSGILFIQFADPQFGEFKLVRLRVTLALRASPAVVLDVIVLDIVKLPFLIGLQIVIDLCQLPCDGIGARRRIAVVIVSLADEVGGSPGFDDGQRLLPESLAVGPLDQVEELDVIGLEQRAVVLPDALSNHSEELLGECGTTEALLLMEQLTQAVDSALDV